jgi:hypothetical protein
MRHDACFAPEYMVADRPTVSTPSPGIVLVRYEWPHHLVPDVQGEFLESVRAASAEGPVAIVFSIGTLIREIAPSVRVFWRRVVTDPSLRISAMAVVTESWAVGVETEGFGVTNEMDGALVRVATFENEADGIAWAERARSRPRHTPAIRVPAGSTPPRAGE